MTVVCSTPILGLVARPNGLGRGSGKLSANRAKRGRNALELLTETLAYRGVEESLLVRDRALAASVVSHFRGLIEGQMLISLPGS